MIINLPTSQPVLLRASTAKFKQSETLFQNPLSSVVAVYLSLSQRERKGVFYHLLLISSFNWLRIYGLVTHV